MECFWQTLINSLWLQAIEAILAMIGFWKVISWPILIIWPNRDRWLAEFIHNGHEVDTVALKKTLSKDKRLHWISPEPQSPGDIYRIDFGKYRVIDGIEFHEKMPTNEFPYKWQLAFLNEWGGDVQRRIVFEHERIVEEFPAVKISAIEIIILEPRMKDDGTPYHWRIERVYFREIKFKLLRPFRGKI